ncbi:hypothetical protein J8273_1138 [Carpediemonas membranifera]|uniref:Uncharacterized protein n=2 Tax=Carpediemonas membranifera TaxID=201153 RepID=A0A8J6BGV8_9EUKA|nr:hypothetical protein J8273_5195 [Carpediemonas membranifera]KAG9395900.1 hypothetical protein J8273_2235 [Carpediemonas membranifera]KAG9397227.1 hypothetical protein J8273_1138 [Carpediemonas membranifera]|eukprot:KAG9392212.1 hypothetical protein J8273_5195 [Carpediemonas membranifera]
MDDEGTDVTIKVKKSRNKVLCTFIVQMKQEWTAMEAFVRDIRNLVSEKGYNIAESVAKQRIQVRYKLPNDKVFLEDITMAAWSKFTRCSKPEAYVWTADPNKTTASSQPVHQPRNALVGREALHEAREILRAANPGLTESQLMGWAHSLASGVDGVTALDPPAGVQYERPQASQELAETPQHPRRPPNFDLDAYVLVPVPYERVTEVRALLRRAQTTPAPVSRPPPPIMPNSLNIPDYEHQED